MRRALAVVALAALALTGCTTSDQQSAAPQQSSSPNDPSTSPSASDSGESPTGSSGSGMTEAIDVEIKGNEIQPNGKRVQVAVGEPIRLHVESDRAAELHVHSSPEQELAVRKGESTVSFTVKTPGIVDVEEHESGIVILQLEVS